MSVVRTRRIRLSLVAAASAMLAATAFTQLPGSGGQEAGEEKAGGKKTVEWIAVNGIDTQPQHVEAGDSWTEYLELYKSRAGEPGSRIGDGSARCSAVAVTDRGVITQCQHVLRTRKDSLVLSGMTDRFGSGPYTADSAVVGGTGRYEDAEGQARITVDGERTRFRVHLDD